MAFARTIVEQNTVPYNFLQLSHKHSDIFLEQLRSSSRTQSIKVKNYSRIVPGHFAGGRCIQETSICLHM